MIRAISRWWGPRLNPSCASVVIEDEWTRAWRVRHEAVLARHPHLREVREIP